MDIHRHSITDAANDDGSDITRVDMGDHAIYPAPLDLHFHGCGGISVAPDGDVAAMETAHTNLVSRSPGWSIEPSPLLSAVPGYLATLPIPGTAVSSIVSHLATAAHQLAAASTQCEGLRLEGCFINPKQAGVWPTHGLAACDTGLLDELIDAAADAGMPLRIVDVAPELPGAIELIEHARSRNIVVAMAHTHATYDEALRGFDAGVTLATHLFNAMTGIHHRAPGAAGAAVDDARVTVELICDGIHVHPAAARIAVRAAGPGRSCLVSDASPFAGAQAGTYAWNGMRITCDGRSLRNEDGALAGSHAVLSDVFREGALGMQLADQDVAAMCSSVPRSVLVPERPLGLVTGDRIWAPETGMHGTRLR